MLRDRPEAWPVESRRDLHRDDWVMALRQDTLHRPGHPDEEPFRRLVLEAPGAVIVLALDGQDRVLCLRQYRHAVQQALVELPAGLLDVAGEEPLEVARRELHEEAGLVARDWTHLVSAYPSPGISSELHHYFLARNLAEGPPSDFVLEHEEAEMELFWVPFAELRAAVLAGRVADAPVALAVLVCEARGLARAAPVQE
jgi:8-oxo-dGTP pyrophosphatase MutT (NUDIX family)